MLLNNPCINNILFKLFVKFLNNPTFFCTPLEIMRENNQFKLLVFFNIKRSNIEIIEVNKNPQAVLLEG